MVVTMLIGVVAPALVALVTKASTSSTVKALLNAAIALAVGIGQGFVDTPADVTWDWQTAVFFGITAFITSVATYFGLLKPTPTNNVLQASFIKDKPSDDVFDEPQAA
jgi:hypothetical protein